ncbi:CIC11C00000005345 [Sungouiella intermedia]|uniref:MICOS complex subunit MIC12 n=1 Tax=Sungouiella intermedia TaxID=45354 RepID=A0A1L0D8N4_9ASCO|nr:CIC11C00000004318 [[Candida] intermedia]SGZ52197.1 CIC11C00000005345 [[Candida] intermedia]
MGNRIQGFLAGVALTSSIVLATSGRIQATLLTAAGIIRDTDSIINNRILTDRDSQLVPLPVNKRVSATYRPSVWETSKDIWNEEIIKVANWLYSINWYQWGLEADRKINTLTDKVVQMAVEKKN